jgi:hypothetical protein
MECLGWVGFDNLLINGFADGADKLTRTGAILRGWQVKDVLPRDYQDVGMSYGRACNVRNQAMVNSLKAWRMDPNVLETRSVAFWRAHSQGTLNTIRMLESAGFEPDVFYDCPCHS